VSATPLFQGAGLGTCQGLDRQGQGPSLQVQGPGQGLDLQGQGQGQGLTSLVVCDHFRNFILVFVDS